MDNNILRKKSNGLMLSREIRSPFYYEKLYIYAHLRIYVNGLI